MFWVLAAIFEWWFKIMNTMPEQHPYISFVVLSYNFEQYLGECVTSILAQEGDHSFEIIVVDDASTDGTPALLDTFTDPRIRIIQHATNQGHAATVMDGLRAACGQLIARIDGDDRYRPTFLNEVMPIFARYPEVGLVYGDVRLIDKAGTITLERSDRAHRGHDFKGNELVALLTWNFICAPTIIARREAWLATLPVPSHLSFHDWYFTTMIARSWDFYYCNRVLADYRVHPGNMHTHLVHKKAEEPSIIWVLHTIFNSPEADSALEQAKQRARRTIYAQHYLTFADKYFGVGFDRDAQRCYLRVLFYQPRLMFRPGPLRRLIATYIGRVPYAHLKQAFRLLQSLRIKLISP